MEKFLKSVPGSLKEDENFVQNVHNSVLEIARRVGGEVFPVANNYRERDYIEYYHDQALPNVKGEVSIGTVLDVPISYHTRDDSTQHRTFQAHQTKTIARYILSNLARIFRERSQRRGIFMEEWSYRKSFLQTIVGEGQSLGATPLKAELGTLYELQSNI